MKMNDDLRVPHSWTKPRLRAILEQILEGANVNEEEFSRLTSKVFSIYLDGRVDGVQELTARMTERWAKAKEASHV
jgi:hypothetical protein